MNDDIYEVMVNRWAFVNRLSFWLATGSTDETLEYVEKRMGHNNED